MKEFELKGYKIESCQFVNKLTGVQKIELSHKYSYNVGYSANNTCRGEFRAEIADKNHPDQFSLIMIVSAGFTTAPGAAKEVLHVKTYDAIFPYVKSIITTFTASAGIPPIYIPYIDISDKNIYRMEMPKPADPS